MSEKITCANLSSYLTGYDLVLSCDMTKNGWLRIATQFRYPNGSHVDVFLDQTGVFQHVTLSDFGQTADYLAETGLQLTLRRKQIVLDVCATLGVSWNGNALSMRECSSAEGLLTNIAVLAQACLRVADLSYTQRWRSVSKFEAQIENFIAATALEYDTEIELLGKANKPVAIDFSVVGETSSSLIQAWSPNASSSRPGANEIFRRWHDLSGVRDNFQFITVLDEATSPIRQDDWSYIQEYSQIYTYPSQQDSFRQAFSR